MKTVLLTRFKDDTKQTLGTITVDAGNEIFVCKTMELPWKNNERSVSCIPPGKYPVQWTRSNRLSAVKGHDVFTYEVFNVPNRGGIRMHAANYAHELKGCIALGAAHKDINADGNLDVIHSGATMRRFSDLLRREDFLLRVRFQILF